MHDHEHDTTTIIRPRARPKSRASTQAPARSRSTARSAEACSRAPTSSARSAPSSTAGERSRTTRTELPAARRPDHGRRRGPPALSASGRPSLRVPSGRSAVRVYLCLPRSTRLDERLPAADHALRAGRRRGALDEALARRAHLPRRARPGAAGPTPSSSRRPTSPACCTWATRSTTPSRTSSRATTACSARTPAGWSAPTTPASPRRTWSRRCCAPRASPRRTWAARSSSPACGSGARSTAAPSSSSSSAWAARATTTASASPSTRATSRAVTKVFVALYEKGYIHKDSYLVNWCPRCGTAISDLEVAYQDMPGTLNYIRYEVDGGGSVTIATTRPETMLGDTAVAVHPDDERYKDVVGKTATLPLLGRELKIVADERVDPEFGTGALKITPAHDLTDFDIGRTHGLEAVQAIGQDGRITEAGGPYAGLEVEEAAERVVDDLQALGALVKVEDYPHSVATCDRCGTPIEPLISEQWFMDMDAAQEAGHRRRPRRQGQVHARALGPRVHRLDGQPAALVHQPPALVGPPAAGVVLPGRPRHRGRDRAAGLCRVRLHRAHARDRRARHLVQLGAVAVRHVRLAGRRPRTSPTSTRPTCSARRATSSSCGSRAWS